MMIITTASEPMSAFSGPRVHLLFGFWSKHLALTKKFRAISLLKIGISQHDQALAEQ
jgi:hypothetical protein